MGFIRVPGLNFSLSYLQSEAQQFHTLMLKEGWLSDDNVQARRDVVHGLSFIMLNLGPEVDKHEAYHVYETVMEEYHHRCEALEILF